MPRKEHHIVPATQGGWNVKKSGAEKASVHTTTKEKAMELGKEIAKNQGSELVIHNKDGKISNSNSYGNDPIPPRDKKH